MIQILYIEDEQDMVEFLPIVLKKADINLLAMTSISAALELLKNKDFDAVLLDIMMPPEKEMDLQELDYGRKTGIEVARSIKKIKPSVPIVAFTALSDEIIHAEMRSAGIIEIIKRPAEVNQIIHALRVATGTGD